MSKRKAISKTIRFEVFKRDRFTCQYCGAKAPDVVLQVDHIHPVAEDGAHDILNFVTACVDCNSGKGARKLDDRSAVERQRVQIEELQERREQLEMMLAWRDAEQSDATDTVEEVADRIGERGGYIPNESGKADIRRWLKKFSLPEVLTALDAAFDHYMKFNGSAPDRKAWGVAFSKIPVFANMNRQAVDKPYLPRLLYIQGILRKRCEEPYENFIERLEGCIENGWTTDHLEEVAKKSRSWSELLGHLHKLAEAMRGR